MGNTRMVQDEVDAIRAKAMKSRLLNNEWEKKLMAKGYKYVEVLGQTVRTMVFASPQRQKIIEEENRLFLKREKNKRITTYKSKMDENEIQTDETSAIQNG